MPVYATLPRRMCTADSPMPAALRDNYQWSHPEAEAVQPFFNLVIYTCPHCNHTFHAEPRKPA
jgi:hypothetical protein